MVRIRRAGLEDLPGVARVLVDTWRATYRGVVPEAFLEGLSYEGQAERWAQRLKTPTWPGRLFVAESESGEVVGFAAFGPDRASGFPGYTAELWAIYVLPTWQRKGLGRALFHEEPGCFRQRAMGGCWSGSSRRTQRGGASTSTWAGCSWGSGRLSWVGLSSGKWPMGLT